MHCLTWLLAQKRGSGEPCTVVPEIHLLPFVKPQPCLYPQSRPCRKPSCPAQIGLYQPLSSRMPSVGASRAERYPIWGVMTAPLYTRCSMWLPTPPHVPTRFSNSTPCIDGQPEYQRAASTAFGVTIFETQFSAFVRLLKVLHLLMPLSANVSTVLVSGKNKVPPPEHDTWYCESGRKPDELRGVLGSKFSSRNRHQELDENPAKQQRQ